MGMYWLSSLFTVTCFVGGAVGNLTYSSNHGNCSTVPCENEALCEDTATGYQCFCVDGYAGSNCEINFDDCSSLPCLNSGTCIDDVAAYRCLCQPGFTGENCQKDINECISDPCLRDGRCIDLINSFVCECPSPYKGDNCSLLPCEELPCENGAVCYNDVELNYTTRGYFCDCVSGFSGLQCEINIDDCNSTSCSGQGICVDGVNDYSCLCEPGFVGEDCEFPVNDCIGNECRNNATCHDLHLGYWCECLVPGYEGSLCERERDECSSLKPCQNGATCVDKLNGYSCLCTENWSGKNCTEEVNRCRKNPCSNNAGCIDLEDGFLCQCQPFYTGRLCEIAYNPCATEYSPCQNEAECIAPPDGQYRCFCQTGFTGKHCEVNVNECLSFPCENNATCEDILAGYVCHCMTGWTGQNCQINIDDCISFPCLNEGECVDLINRFECNCTDHYTGYFCEDLFDYCLSDPCYHDASCSLVVRGYQCHCLPPYTGLQCLDVIDACRSEPCHNNGSCINLSPGFHCNCLRPYTGVTCEETISYCDSEPCLNDGLCRDGIDSFFCICPPLLTGKQCTDLIDYCDSRPCRNDGICLNSHFTYRCLCAYGFKGVNCTDMVDFCVENPCQNLGNCSNIRGGYVCECTYPFYGPVCESVLPSSIYPASTALSTATVWSISISPSQVSLIPKSSSVYFSVSLPMPSLTVSHAVITYYTDAVTLTSGTRILIEAGTLSSSMRVVESLSALLSRTSIPRSSEGASITSQFSMFKSIERGTSRHYTISSSRKVTQTMSVIYPKSNIDIIRFSLVDSSLLKSQDGPEIADSNLDLFSTLKLLSSVSSIISSSKASVFHVDISGSILLSFDTSLKPIPLSSSRISLSRDIYKDTIPIPDSSSAKISYMTVLSAEKSHMSVETTFKSLNGDILTATKVFISSSLLSIGYVYSSIFETVELSTSSERDDLLSSIVTSPLEKISNLTLSVLSAFPARTDSFFSLLPLHSSDIFISATATSGDTHVRSTHIESQNIMSKTESSIGNRSETGHFLISSSLRIVSPVDSFTVSYTPETVSPLSDQLSSEILPIILTLLTSTPISSAPAEVITSTVVTQVDISRHSSALVTDSSRTSGLYKHLSPSLFASFLESSSLAENTYIPILSFQKISTMLTQSYASSPHKSSSKTIVSSSFSQGILYDSLSSSQHTSFYNRTSLSPVFKSEIYLDSVSRMLSPDYQSLKSFKSSDFGSQWIVSPVLLITSSAEKMTPTASISTASVAALTVSTDDISYKSAIQLTESLSTANTAVLTSISKVIVGSSEVISTESSANLLISDVIKPTPTSVTVDHVGNISAPTPGHVTLLKSSNQTQTMSELASKWTKVSTEETSNSVSERSDLTSSLITNLFSSAFISESDLESVSTMVSVATKARHNLTIGTSSAQFSATLQPVSMFESESLFITSRSRVVVSAIRPSSVLQSNTKNISDALSVLDLQSVSTMVSVATKARHSLTIGTSSPQFSTALQPVSMFESESLFIFSRSRIFVSAIRPSSVLQSNTKNMSDALSVLNSEFATLSSFLVDSRTGIPSVPSLTSETTLEQGSSSIEGSKSIDTGFMTSATSFATSVFSSVDAFPVSRVVTNSVAMTTESADTECDSVKCYNGGVCKSNRSGVCDCPRRFTGSYCETAITMPVSLFHVAAIIQLENYDVDNSLAIQMSFQTVQDTGTLVYYQLRPEATASTVQLQIVEGNLQIHIMCRSQSFVLDTQYKVNNARMYTITLRQNEVCQLSIDLVDNTFERPTLTWIVGTNQLTEIDHTTRIVLLLIGGLSSELANDYDRNFTGCLGEVWVNGIPLWMNDSLNSVKLEECSTLGSGELCKDVDCLNGGECHVTWTITGMISPVCDCMLPYTGVRCETETLVYYPSFDGTSYLEFAPPSFHANQSNEIYLSVRPREADGMLLISANQNHGDIQHAFIYLYLEDWILWYKFSCDGKTTGTISSKKISRMDETLEIIIRQSWTSDPGQWCNAALIVNSVVSVSQPFLSIDQSQLLGDLFIGGTPRNSSLLSNTEDIKMASFVGCIKDLQVNDFEVDLIAMATKGMNIGNCGIPVCEHNPCENGATCHSSGDDWYCDCLPGYSGRLCGNKLCASNVCSHGGTCVVMETQNDQLCLCPLGRGGVLCEKAVDISMPHFSGSQYGYSSFMAYENMVGMEDAFEMKFNLILDNITGSQNDLLFLMGNKVSRPTGDFMALGVYKDHVVFRYNLGSGIASIWSKEPLDNTLPHHAIQFGRHGREGWLKIDGQQTSTGKSPGILTVLNTDSILYVGGAEMDVLKLMSSEIGFSDGLRGCVYNLLISSNGGEFIAPGSPPGSADYGRSIRQCSSLTCDDGPCQNEVECIEVGASVYCNCTEEWKGLFCTEETTPCDLQHGCAEGATCLPLVSGGYECLCPLGRKGPSCSDEITISDPSFVGEKSYMSFSPVYIKQKMDIRLQIKPTVTDGIVFYVAERLHSYSGDFLSLVLHDEKMEMRYHHGDQLNVLVSDLVLETESDKWYTVKAGRNTTHGYLSVNDRYLVAITTGMMSYLDTATDFYLGGVSDLELINPSAVPTEPYAFQGCIRELTVNGKNYQLTEEGASEGRNIEDCDGTSCGYSVCSNGGTCLVTDMPPGYICTCTEYYYGDTCEQPMECRELNCHNGGVCRRHLTGNYGCLCLIGWTGSSCETAVHLGTSVNLTRDSYIQYVDPQYEMSNKTYTQVALTFKTSELNGLLIWNGQSYSDEEDYFGLGLRDGRVQLVWNLGWYSRSEIITSNRYNDGQWHTILIERHGQVLTMTINGAEWNGRVPGDFVNLDTHGLFYMGGFGDAGVHSNSLGFFTDTFQGCLKDLYVHENGPVSFQSGTVGWNIVNCD